MSFDKVSRLDDEVLDQISGGTNQEMFSLQRKTGVSNMKEIIDTLDEHGIRATLRSGGKNEYEDKTTGKLMTHSEVMAVLSEKQ